MRRYTQIFLPLLGMAGLCFVVWSCGATQWQNRSAAEAGSLATAGQETPPSALIDAIAAVKQAPDRQWIWVDVPGARCGDGNATGFAANIAAGSSELLVMYEGGGACYDYLTCYQLHAASNISTDINAASFQSGGEAFVENKFFPTSRTDATNPFNKMNLVFIPYCTGDLHDGNHVIQYPGAPSKTYHQGAINSRLATQVLAFALPQISHMWVSGYSAGGFGAILNYEMTQAAFPRARVDLIADSSESVAGMIEHSSWQAVVPAALPGLDANNFSTLMPAFAKANPKSRFAALSFARDNVLPTYEFLTEDAFAAQIQSDFSAIDQFPNAKTFIAPGEGHVVFNQPQATAGGMSLALWLRAMVEDDAQWRSVP